MQKKFIIFISIAILASGCSFYTVDSQNASEEFYPSKKSANDVVYLENVDKPHDVIGYVTVTTERNQHMNEVIEKMRHEAAILGADAITDIKTDATGVWKKLPAQKVIGNAYIRANFTATAVVFK